MRPAALPELAPQWPARAGRGPAAAAGSLERGSARSPRPAVAAARCCGRWSAAPARSRAARAPDLGTRDRTRRAATGPHEGRRDVRLLPHGAAHLAWSPRQRCASSPPAARSLGTGGLRGRRWACAARPGGGRLGDCWVSARLLLPLAFTRPLPTPPRPAAHPVADSSLPLTLSLPALVRLPLSPTPCCNPLGRCLVPRGGRLGRAAGGSGV